MLNNLDRYPSLVAKYGALFTWINAVELMAIRMQITFITYKKLMETVAVELAVNPTNKF
jgi:hypothetical protein